MALQRAVLADVAAALVGPGGADCAQAARSAASRPRRMQERADMGADRPVSVEAGEDKSAASPAGRKARRGTRPLTPERLERAALAYVERFATSAGNLRRVLMRRVERSARAHGTDRAEGAAWVEALLARWQRSGLLNDRLYAEGKARTLARQGRPGHVIARTLAAKGVGAEEVETAVAGLVAEDPDADLTAAVAYARRKRLGPFRRPAERAERRQKDMAALARRGFSYEIARRVIDAADADAFDEATTGAIRNAGIER